jgi:hypothetical protein
MLVNGIISIISWLIIMLFVYLVFSYFEFRGRFEEVFLVGSVYFSWLIPTLQIAQIPFTINLFSILISASGKRVPIDFVFSNANLFDPSVTLQLGKSDYFSILGYIAVFGIFTRTVIFARSLSALFNIDLRKSLEASAVSIIASTLIFVSFWLVTWVIIYIYIT